MLCLQTSAPMAINLYFDYVRRREKVRMSVWPFWSVILVCCQAIFLMFIVSYLRCRIQRCTFVMLAGVLSKRGVLDKHWHYWAVIEISLQFMDNDQE